MRKEDLIAQKHEELKHALKIQNDYIVRAQSFQEKIDRTATELQELCMLKDIRDEKLLLLNADTFEPVTVKVIDFS